MAQSSGISTSTTPGVSRRKTGTRGSQTTGKTVDALVVVAEDDEEVGRDLGDLRVEADERREDLGDLRLEDDMKGRSTDSGDWLEGDAAADCGDLVGWAADRGERLETEVGCEEALGLLAEDEG